MFGVRFKNVSEALAAALLVFLLAANVYRAATQSITADEARMAAPFNNNLGTWLSTMCVHAFGASEFTMRLPSLLAGALYFYALFGLCGLLFGSQWYFLLAIAVNSLNPYLLDYFSAARGYGLAIAFWTAAVYCIVRWAHEEDRDPWKLPLLAGAGFGLSILSHVTAVFPVAAFVFAFVIVYSFKNGARFLLRTAAPMLAVCAVIAAIVLWPLLHQPQTGSIDGVVEKYRDGLKSLVACYLFYKQTMLTAWRPVHRLAWLTLPALFAGLLLAAVQLPFRGRPKKDTVVLLFSLAVPLTFLLLWIEPQIYHHGFFAGRRLLVTCPLIFLAAPVWLNWLASGTKPERILAVAGSVLLGFSALVFVLEWNVSSYQGWEQDAGSKTAMKFLRLKRPAEATATARLGADMYLDEGLNFYRELNQLDWLKPVTRDSPECSYDFYYVREETFETVKRFGLTELHRDPIARTVLAEPSAEARKRETALRQLGFDSTPACTADFMANFCLVENSIPGSERAMLRDFMSGPAGRWRWTFERPALLMSAPKRPNTKFSMDFVIHSATFKDTGPIRLSVIINGQKIGEKLYTSAENQTFTAAVPDSALRDDGIALVETRLDKYYQAPDDAQKLGYLFVRAGFLPH